MKQIIIFGNEQTNLNMAFFDSSWFIGIWAGFISSVLFLVFIYILRPRIKISPQISKSTKAGKTVYQIKIVNKSFFKVIDIHFELTLMHPMGEPKGRGLKMKRIQLKADKLWYISARDTFIRKSEYAPFAVRVIILEDLEQVWNQEEDFLDFKIIAKHGFSGFNKVIRERFNHNSCIIDGEFENGTSMVIQPN